MKYILHKTKFIRNQCFSFMLHHLAAVKYLVHQPLCNLYCFFVPMRSTGIFQEKLMISSMIFLLIVSFYQSMWDDLIYTPFVGLACGNTENCSMLSV